jgi:ATP-dependent exoDNAse (exonuclease V) beta subunit
MTKAAHNTTFRFPEVRVVEASAGSGKTYALAKRYVQLLMHPGLAFDRVPIRHILAVTFTNKAAFEMKARILDFLKRIALKNLPDREARDILDPVQLSLEEASRKAYRIMEELIRHYNFFQVQTIDAFINALLAGCSFKIGLSARFKIRRNSLDYLQYSLDRLIERAVHDGDVREIFVRFLHQYLFLENKPGWFPKKDILLLLGALYQQNNIFAMEFELFDKDPESLIILKRKILSDMRALRDLLPEDTDGRFRGGLEDFLKKYSKGFDTDKISDYFARGDFPVRKGGIVSEEVHRLWQEVTRDIRLLCEGEAHALFNPYIRLFHQVMKIFKVRAAKDDVLFLEELNKKARSLFDEEMVTVEELYYRLATRYHHYLVDEFQDTSRLQWNNLHLMVEEALASGGSLFYVGDKKQAIYGFRGGEVRLFDHLQRQFQPFNVQHEQLQRNYRSHEAVVSFNNDIFSLDNLRRFIEAKRERDIQKRNSGVVFSDEDIAELGNVFGTARQIPMTDKPGGYVRIEEIDIDRKEERDEIIRQKVLALIRQLCTRYSYQDIAVLTRGNLEVEQLTGWLMAEGIPVKSERTLNIKENPLIQELVAFLQFLDSPIDDRAFIRFLAGDIFRRASGLSEAEIHQFLFALRAQRQKERHFYVYKAVRDRFPGPWEMLIEDFFKQVGLYPLYELAASILHRYQVLRHFPQQQGFVMRFLELIKEQEEEGSDLSRFLEIYEDLNKEDLYVNVTHADAVQIQTIHKTKGLEFPVVIIPFLGMDVQVGSGGGIGQQSYIIDLTGGRLDLLRIKKKYLKFSDNLSAIWRRGYIQALLGELNNIYVALTRAGKELYGFIPKKIGSSWNEVNLLIPEDLREKGVPLAAASVPVIAGQDPQRRILPLSDCHDWIAFLVEEFSGLRRAGQREHLRQGEVAHAILAHIGPAPACAVPRILDAAIGKVRDQYPSIDDLPRRCRPLVEGLLKTEELRPFFDPVQAEVICEAEVVNAYGDTRRMDRLIIWDHAVWVIDYKSSRNESGDAPRDESSAHHEQVRGYMTLLREIYPGRRIQGFLIYLDEARYVEVAHPPFAA